MAKVSVPLIISTGGMVEDELLELVELVLDHDPGICLMHCTAEYPTPLQHLNLLRIQYLTELVEDYGKEEWEVGWSSHEGTHSGCSVAAAVALGATQFEVHVKPFAEAALTGDERCALPCHALADYTSAVREAQVALGEEWTGRMAPPDREQVLEWRKRWMK